MTIVVPFDGCELSQTALVRATMLGEAFDERVLALTIVPDNDAEYARERDWLGQGEKFDRQTVVGRLREHVVELAPRAEFRDETVGRYASTGTIATKLRRAAKDAEASLVVIGSDNAGHMVSSIHSVGSTVASDEAFDVLIVRRSIPTDAAPEETSGW
ncbi:universal stress protein [Halorussus sp. MSC15.2]|uniref:universal stress protein n=1 Tax=Halorussus sp. MSC15.2 TaxID=2283638 RepID=UPI0013D6D829|nr:universal stress protein [Halorussus sp. MSC15.2]NEU55522.1 universal stress protein [Halorussus sp. MSC15.2]